MNLAIIIASTVYTVDKALDLYKKFLECKKLRLEIKKSDYKPKH